ncbi:MAG: peptidoglycan-binding domain-containing protein [Ktedonobacteraceae bacterium]
MYRRKLLVILGLTLLLLCSLALTSPSSTHAFAASANVSATRASDTTCPPEVGFGNTGKWVKFVQEGLNTQYEASTFTNHPYNFHPHSQQAALTVDGIFGRDTENATKDFQVAHHLSVDGIVGPATWHALGGC